MAFRIRRRRVLGGFFGRLSWNRVDLSENECYTMTVRNGANMTLDLMYTLDGIPRQPILRVSGPEREWNEHRPDLCFRGDSARDLCVYRDPEHAESQRAVRSCQYPAHRS